MLVDLIGSRALRHVTEFKNFPYKVNNFIIDQSILTLTSEPIPTSMKDINTTDLTDITIAHRDLNKGQWEKLQNSNSDILIIDLLGELRSVSELDESYYSTDSLAFINEGHGKKLSRVQQFRKLQEEIDELFIETLNSYDKVILVKFHTHKNKDDDFIAGIFELFEEKIDNKLLLEYSIDAEQDVFNAPLEFYHEVNMGIKRFESDSYENQLLFNELLSNDTLSVFMNYIGIREYVYELYKNGKPYLKSKPTYSRTYAFKLSESAKYRIRVNLVDESIKPRLSQTFEYVKGSQSQDSLSYIEMPDNNNLWLLDVILETEDVKGIVGNLFKFKDGYNGIPVYDYSEITTQYKPANELFATALNNIIKMDHISFTKFINENDVAKDSLFYDFLNFVKTKR